MEPVGVMFPVVVVVVVVVGGGMLGQVLRIRTVPGALSLAILEGMLLLGLVGQVALLGLVMMGVIPTTKDEGPLTSFNVKILEEEGWTSEQDERFSRSGLLPHWPLSRRCNERSDMSTQ